ncbi:DUF2892 domain-containing protein [Fibrobacterota bacterium]
MKFLFTFLISLTAASVPAQQLASLTAGKSDVSLSQDMFAEDILPNEAFEEANISFANIGTADRIIRACVGAVLAGTGSYLVFAGSNPAGYLPLGVSIMPLMNAVSAWSPLYHTLGINTKKSKVYMMLHADETAMLQYVHNF